MYTNARSSHIVSAIPAVKAAFGKKKKAAATEADARPRSRQKINKNRNSPQASG